MTRRIKWGNTDSGKGRRGFNPASGRNTVKRSKWEPIEPQLAPLVDVDELRRADEARRQRDEDAWTQALRKVQGA